jgi:DNA-directed RNA polymerase specialized sigma24 family protein
MGDTPSQLEVREAYEAGMAVAVAITRSRALAEDFVQQAFEAVYGGARPWSRDRGAFAKHVMGAVRSIISNTRVAKREERDSRAHQKFQYEVGTRGMTAEERILEHAEDEGAQAEAEKELDEVDASLGDNADARAVLRCRRESEEPLKAGEIARRLEMPVARVYRANELIRDHLEKLRGTKTKRKTTE